MSGCPASGWSGRTGSSPPTRSTSLSSKKISDRPLKMASSSIISSPPPIFSGRRRGSNRSSKNSTASPPTRIRSISSSGPPVTSPGRFSGRNDGARARNLVDQSAVERSPFPSGRGGLRRTDLLFRRRRTGLQKFESLRGLRSEHRPLVLASFAADLPVGRGGGDDRECHLYHRRRVQKTGREV